MYMICDIWEMMNKWKWQFVYYKFMKIDEETFTILFSIVTESSNQISWSKYSNILFQGKKWMFLEQMIASK